MSSFVKTVITCDGCGALDETVSENRAESKKFHVYDITKITPWSSPPNRKYIRHFCEKCGETVSLALQDWSSRKARLGREKP